MYQIRFDPHRSVLMITVSGFWSGDTIQRFAEDFARERAKVRAAGAPFGVLGDASDFAIQSRETTEGLTGMVAAATRIGGVPTALVLGSSLGKMQAERAMAAPHIRVFTDRDAAHAWLATAIASEPQA